MSPRGRFSERLRRLRTAIAGLSRRDTDVGRRVTTRARPAIETTSLCRVCSAAVDGTHAVFTSCLGPVSRPRSMNSTCRRSWTTHNASTTTDCPSKNVHAAISPLGKAPMAIFHRETQRAADLPALFCRRTVLARSNEVLVAAYPGASSQRGRVDTDKSTAATAGGFSTTGTAVWRCRHRRRQAPSGRADVAFARPTRSARAATKNDSRTTPRDQVVRVGWAPPYVSAVDDRFGILIRTRTQRSGTRTRTR